MKEKERAGQEVGEEGGKGTGMDEERGKEALVSKALGWE